MADVIRGGCLCRRVRYEHTGDVGPANYCYRSDRRRCTGSAHNIGVGLRAGTMGTNRPRVAELCKGASVGCVPCILG